MKALLFFPFQNGPNCLLKVSLTLEKSEIDEDESIFNVAEGIYRFLKILQSNGKQHLSRFHPIKRFNWHDLMQHYIKHLQLQLHLFSHFRGAVLPKITNAGLFRSFFEGEKDLEQITTSTECPRNCFCQT